MVFEGNSTGGTEAKLNSAPVYNVFDLIVNEGILRKYGKRVNHHIRKNL